MNTKPVILILAGGKSSRFRSRTPKALHPVLGKPVATLVLDAVRALKPSRTFAVVGDWGEEFTRSLAGAGVELIRQKEDLGTGGAVFSARRALTAEAERDILVIQSNLPLLTGPTLKALLGTHRKRGYSETVLCAPGTPFDIPLGSLSCAVCAFKVRDLLKALGKIRRQSGGSFPLSDAVGLLARSRRSGVCLARKAGELFEVGTRYDLALVAAFLHLRKIRALALKGVSFLDPASTWIDLDVRVGEETVIHPSVIIEGNSRIGKDCRIHPFVHIRNARIGNRVRIFGSTDIEDCVLEDDSQAGPFSRLRPKTVVRAGARVGNFVEMKNTVFGPRSKALHLSYLGDSEVGEDVNIGAGTITCNYDGVRKNRTTIEDGVFIGSGTELIAPVKVGRKAYVAAGSTITKDVAPEALAVARARQVEIPGWVRRKKR
jgi:bifunctional UDP-N-acetylglucosamine pyrophosphorylase/glucosamine-1-phosphate N-acetyltransferase